MRLRWFAIAGQFVTVVGVRFGLGYEFHAGICLVFIALSAWLNVYLTLQYPARHRLKPDFATALLAYDIVQLGALLYLTGGIQNPFSLMLMAPVIVSASTLPTRNTLVLGAVSVAVGAALVGYYQPLPWETAGGLNLPLPYRFGLWISLITCLVFLGLYAWRLSRESKLMSDALAATELVLAREQQLHALDGMAAAAAHELGTPLSTITVVAKELERDLKDIPGTLDDVALIRSQAARCRKILESLTQRSEDSDPLFGRSTIRQLLTEAAEPHMVFDTQVAIDAQPHETALGEGRREPSLERSPGVLHGLGNLIENAVDFAMSRVEIEARWSEEEITVIIHDDGAGFPPQMLASLGEPYVTMRSSRSSEGAGSGAGLGLGFFIAKTLLERSGAGLELSNAEYPETGAIVTIRWPRDVFDMTPETRSPATERPKEIPEKQALPEPAE